MSEDKPRQEQLDLDGMDPEPEGQEDAERDPEAGEPEEGCAPADGAETGGSKRKRTKADSKTSPTPTPAPAPRAAASPAASKTTFLYPFNVRYAAEIIDLSGFVDGQLYTEEQIRDLLIQNGYTEFQDIEPAFHLSTNTNTVVITIKGSRKGYGR